MKRITPYILLFVLMFLFVSEAKVKELDNNDIHIRVEIGYEDNLPIEGKWMPVNITTVNNTDEFIKGEIIFTFEYEKTESTSCSIELPGRATRTSTIYVFYTGQNRYRVTFKDDKGKIIYRSGGASIPLNTNRFSNMNLIGVMSSDKGTISYLKNMENMKYGDYSLLVGKGYVVSATKVVSIDKDNFPTRKEAISAFNAIFINNYDLSNLTLSQKNMLDYYIRTGGTVIFSYCHDYVDMKEYTDIHVESVSKEDVPLNVRELNDQSNTLNLTVANINDENLSLIATEHEFPLAYRHKDFNIYYLTFALNDGPFVNWTYNYVYLFEFLIYYTNSLKGVDQRTTSYILRDDISRILDWENRSFSVSLITIAVILVIYILIAGPITYAILKKIDRRGLMWFLLPLYALVFSVALYTHGYMTRGGGNSAESITIVELNPYSELQKPAWVVSGLMTSSHGDYTITYGREALFSHNITSYGGNWSTVRYRQGLDTVYKQSGKTSVSMKGATMWSKVYAEASVDVRNYGCIETDVVMNDDKTFTVTLRNSTGYNLESLVVTVSNQVEVIESLNNNQTVTFTFNAWCDTQLEYSSMVWDNVQDMFLKHRTNNQNVYVSNQLSMHRMVSEFGQEQGVNVALLMKMLTCHLGAEEFSVSPQLHIVGFVKDGAELSLRVNGIKPFNSSQLTLVHQSVNLYGYIGYEVVD